MNSLETNSHTVISRSHHNENLLHNNEFSTEHKTLSSFNETVIQEGSERIYASYNYCINIHFNEKNQIKIH